MPPSQPQWEPYQGDPLIHRAPSTMSYAEIRERHPHLNLTQPAQFRMAVRRIAGVHTVGSRQEHEEGRIWYPKSHDVATRLARGKTMLWAPNRHLAAAGIIAATSPASDYDTRNIRAANELHTLSENEWAIIHRSANRSKRTNAAKAVLKGLSLAQTTDDNLVKAHAIMHGANPEEVLPYRTSPKMHSFMWNIHDPSGAHVAVDYRAHDIAAGSMGPSKWSGRGIESAGNVRGTPTRYEHIARAYHAAADVMGEERGNVMQAQTWVIGKRIEKSIPTRSGQPRKKQGAPRRGQPYIVKQRKSSYVTSAELQRRGQRRTGRIS